MTTATLKSIEALAIRRHGSRMSIWHALTPYGYKRLLVANLGLPQWAWMPDPCDQPLMLVARYA